MRGSGGAGTTPTTSGSLACSGTPDGCLCATRAAMANDVDTCSPTSVATSPGSTVCCRLGDLCTCSVYACKASEEMSFCQCGAPSAFPSALIASIASTSCPTMASQKCCLTPDPPRCICSDADCDGGAMMVASCTSDMVAACPTGMQMAASCK